MKSSLPSAVFFDFDGVLVDSTTIKTEAFSSIYAPFGPDILAAALDHHKANEGISRLIKFRHCHKTLLDIELDDVALNELASVYTDRVEEKVVTCEAVRGAEEFLTRYQDQCLLFVVSGTPEDELQRIAERRHLTKYFTEVRGSPATKDAIITDLLERYGLEPNSTLFVGDAMADYNAAMACKVPFVGRVAHASSNPFPENVDIIADLTDLDVILCRNL